MYTTTSFQKCNLTNRGFDHNVTEVSHMSLSRLPSYSNCSKILNTLTHTFIGRIFFMHLFHQILVGIANSVDPDQTGPSHEV